MIFNLSEETAIRLKQLAAEEERAPEGFISGLVLEADRRRHILKPPFEPEKRVRCFSSNCTEKERRLMPGDEYEL